MKFKRILPIIVAVIVLACALVPFAVSADTFEVDSYTILGNISSSEFATTVHCTTLESVYGDLYNGYIRIYFLVDDTLELYYLPPIGTSVIDKDGNERIIECLYYGKGPNINYGTTLRYFLADKTSAIEAPCISRVTYNYNTHEFNVYTGYYNFGIYNNGFTFDKSFCLHSEITVKSGSYSGDVYFDKTIPKYHPEIPPQPTFTDHIANADMSPALVEVLGVLPACLACLVAYASIRKGIGYVHSIISNA